MSTSLTSEKVLVRLVEDNNELHISFKYGFDDMSERHFNFNPSKDEEIQKLFNRINSALIQKMLSIKVKKYEMNENISVQAVQIFLSYNGHIVNSSVTNGCAWKDGQVLQIGSCAYKVVVNIPNVKSLSLPKNIMGGFLVYPCIRFEFANKSESKFVWYKTLDKEVNSIEKLEDSSPEDVKNLSNSEVAKSKSDAWILAGIGYFLMTSASDVGRKLKIVCTPVMGSKCGYKAESVGFIEEGPRSFPFEEQHFYTKHYTTVDCMRCVSYNVLSNTFAESEHARTVLYPYCPAHALSADYRRQLLVKEIVGYNADLICLQEINSSLFKYLVPCLEQLSFDGIFQVKDKVSDGLACFFRNENFRCLNSRNITLSEILKIDPMYRDIHFMLNLNDNLKKRLLERSTLLQTVLLECLDKPNNLVLVANTHLYYHPDAGLIRLLQSIVCIRYLEKLKKNYHEVYPEASIAIIWFGDFNSCPESGVYELITTGIISDESADWNSNEGKTVFGLPLSHSLSFSSACGCPDYTNYTSEFVGCLDYIFYDDKKLIATECVPLPSHEQVTEHIALPSVMFPSDHLALVATLSWI